MVGARPSVEASAEASAEEELTTKLSNFGVEEAITGRAKCKHCNKQIASNTVHIFKLVSNQFHKRPSPNEHYIKQFFHLKFFFQALSAPGSRQA